MVRIFSFLLLYLAMASVIAATISVKTDRDPVALNETFRIIFTVNGSQDDEPDFSPLNQDFELLGTGQSSQFSMLNGRVSSSKTYTLSVAPLRAGKITIPAISFGKDSSQPMTITVNKASQGRQPAGPPAPQADANLMYMTLEPDTQSPYVQQQVILKLKIYRSKQWADASLSDPSVTGAEASVQQLGKPKTYSTIVKGKNYQVTELRYAIFPQQSGQLTINPFQVTARFAAGVKKQSSPFRGFSSDPFFDDFFSRQTYTNQSAATRPITMTVKPIPADFTGKHWLPAKNIQLQESWSGDIDSLETGNPVTRTIALIGDGVASSQLPDIALVEKDSLKVYPDQPMADDQLSDAGLLSTRTFKFAIIPSQPGKHSLPAVEIPWWDISSDQMRIARLDTVALQASGTIPAQAQPATTPSPPTIQDPMVDDPVTAEAIAEQQSSPLMIKALAAAVFTFGLLWLITLYFLIKSKSRQADAKPVHKQQADHPGKLLKAVLSNLKSACKQDNPTAVRDALIEWAEAYWPHNPPHSLEEIASRLPDEPAQHIMQLSSSLYSAQTSGWDGNAIYRSISQLPVKKHETKTKSNDVLEPLYR